MSHLVEETLRSVAEKGGGRYFQYAGNDSVIGDLARELRSMEAIEPLDDAGAVPDERSAPFIALAAVLLLLEWLISDRRPMPAPKSAGRPVARRGRRILGIAIGSAALWAVACGDAALTNETANGLFAAGDYTRALDGVSRPADRPARGARARGQRRQRAAHAPRVSACPSRIRQRRSTGRT